MTPRDIEKLKAIFYFVRLRSNGWYYIWQWSNPVTPAMSEGEAWAKALAHSRSSNGMKATMADKMTWLRTQHGVEVWNDPDEGWAAATIDNPSLSPPIMVFGISPEAAVDALFWKVP